MENNRSISKSSSRASVKDLADWLLQEGNQQVDERQLQEGLEKWQLALVLYREIGDPEGEARSLEKIASAYAYLTGWT